MSYTVHKFDVNYEGSSLSAAIHVVTDGLETSYIVSIDGYENFEIKKDAANQWQAEPDAEVTEQLLELVLKTYQQQ